MARVTVEDCIQVVDNRFELVLLAAQRARDIGAGHALTLNRDDDKNPVVALREIADKTIDLQQLKTNIMSGVNRSLEMTAEDDELAALQRAEEALGGVDEVALAEVAQIEEIGTESTGEELGEDMALEDVAADFADDASDGDEAFK